LPAASSASSETSWLRTTSDCSMVFSFMALILSFASGAGSYQVGGEIGLNPHTNTILNHSLRTL
jgi:hypothetical protein